MSHESVTYDTVENVVKDASFSISIVTPTDTLDPPFPELGIALTSSLDCDDSSEYEPGDTFFNEQDESSDQSEIEATSITPISDSEEYLLSNYSTVGQDESLDQNEIKTVDLHSNVLQDFSSAEVLQFSDKVQVFPSVLGAIGLSSLEMHTESSAVLSVLKLVSAIKGSRALQGLPGTKLSVKWAPDVYDPPATSESHTVKGKGHRRRSKQVKKDYSKQKHGKSKSFRSGVSEKKHTSRRSSSFVDSRSVRFEAVIAVGLAQVQVLDHILPELKCNASFYKESVLPVAEAS